MFKPNSNIGQINIEDPFLTFPKYVLGALSKTWAPYFYQNIFKKINEERFSVLFSGNYSRPNAPVNILVGLLFLKEINGWTDEEMIGALYFDYRVQYALGMTDFEKERICINTVGNFRKRLYEYSEKNKIDLLDEEVQALTGTLIEFIGMDASKARQDSFMISANCKRMGRLELVYTTNANLVKQLAKTDEALIPPSCRHYLEEQDKANHVYRITKDEAEGRLKQLLQESRILLDCIPESLREGRPYENLARLLNEQTKQTDAGVVPKDNSEISANSLQNPSEPDATYRKKGKKANVGYVVNTVEARDEDKGVSMILHHEQQPNITSDVELGQNALDCISGVKTLANDGAYYSVDTVEKAEEKGMEIGFSAMTGKKASEDRIGVHEFTIDENDLIRTCPAGFAPKFAEYNSEKEVYSAKFAKKHCAACPKFDHCPVKEQKKYNKVKFTNKTLQADLCRSKMGDPHYHELAAFRAGVEGVPSVMRRKYKIDDIPVRGMNRSKIWVNCKVMAYNFMSFFSYSKRNAKKEEASTFLSYTYHRFFRTVTFTRLKMAGC